MKSYTSILAQILRLRQSCCHPNLLRRQEDLSEELNAEAAYDAANGLADDMDLNELLDRFTSASSDEDTNANIYGVHVLQQIRDEADHECPICCSEPMDSLCITSCYHAACKDCWLDFIQHEREREKLPLCVVCREPINERDIFEVIREEPAIMSQEKVPSQLDLTSGNQDETVKNQSFGAEIILRRVNTSGSSSKLTALVSKLKELRKLEPATKCTVFSQFTSYLDLIEPLLRRERFPFLRFDGSMSQPARKAVLEKFRSHEGGAVLLISLRAGGVGLNLTEASTVFMMDPWWSFAVEAQAIDRVHRMGQTKGVTVYRFVVEGSVEERMVEKIQARKKFIASSLGMMSDEERKQARIDDIKYLLND